MPMRDRLDRALLAPLTRRGLFRLAGAGAALYLAPACSLSTTGSIPAGSTDAAPLDRTLPDAAPRVFSGDEPERPHRALRDKAAYLAARGGIPAPEQRVPLVIVGGGIAGLLTAYLMRPYKPVLLDQAARFGGNSRGESWRGIDYSIGAAYFAGQEDDSPLQRVYVELGLHRLWRKRTGGDFVELDGRLHDGFWSGATAPRARVQFRAAERYFRHVLNEEGGLSYPEIPALSSDQRRYVDRLDRISFLEHLRSALGVQSLHPHLLTALEHYCWSSFGASSAEVSAASGVNFFAAEFGDILVMPGGNAAVAQRLYERLVAELPPGNLQARATVINLRTSQQGVEIAYEDGDGRLRCLQAKAAVLACPKFVAARIVEDLEPARVAAISRLGYRSYLVANALIDRRLEEVMYDLYLLGAAAADPRRVKMSADRQKVTDVVFGTYARPQANATILTLYRPLPFDGARPEMLADDAYARYRSEFERQLHESILPLLKLDKEHVVDLRLARWGHALPVAAPGLIAEGVVDHLRRPFRGRVFFIQQDNWALPALETAATEALHWTPQVARYLEAR